MCYGTQFERDLVLGVLQQIIDFPQQTSVGVKTLRSGQKKPLIWILWELCSEDVFSTLWQNLNVNILNSCY